MNEQTIAHEHLDTLDRAPRDGPLVMVTAGTAQRQDPREWVDPTQPVDQLRSDVRTAVGDQAFFLGDWAVIDQVGLGPTMIPEHLSIDALHAEAQRRIHPRADSLPNDRSTLERLTDPDGAVWRTPSDLAQSFLDASGLAAALDVLPEPTDTYITVDLERIGRDLATQLGGTIDDAGMVYLPRGTS